MLSNLLKYSYISPQGLKGLDEHKYVPGSYSFLDNLLNPFWLWLAQQVPETMAPNTVTLIGFCFLLTIGLGVFVFDPTLEGKCPPWLYVWFAFSVWSYSCWDAVDGKVARLRNASTPLGSLFDHGCDAAGSSLLVLGVCSCMSFGATIWSLLFSLTILFPFYMAQYESHYAHTVRTQVGNFGVTEGQYTEAALMLITAMFGPEIWDMEIPYTEPLTPYVYSPDMGTECLTLRTVMIYGGCFFPFLLACTSFVEVAKQGGEKLFACLTLIPILGLIGLMVWIVEFANKDNMLHVAYVNQPVPFLLTFGVICAHLSNRVIIACVCGEDYPVVEWQVYLPIAALFASEPYFRNKTEMHTALYCTTGLYFVCVHLHFAVNVALQIAKHLKIHIFKLGKRNE